MKLFGLLFTFCFSFLFAYQPITNEIHILLERHTLSTFKGDTDANHVIFTRNCWFGLPDSRPADYETDRLSRGEVHLHTDGDHSTQTSTETLRLRLTIDPGDPYYQRADRWEVRSLLFASSRDWVYDPIARKMRADIVTEHIISPTLEDQLIAREDGEDYLVVEFDVSWLDDPDYRELNRWLVKIDVVFIIGAYDTENPSRMIGFFYDKENGDYRNMLRAVGDPDVCHTNCDEGS